jgi:TonB family protein
MRALLCPCEIPAAETGRQPLVEVRPLVASPQAANGPPQEPSAIRSPSAGSSRVEFVAISDSDELLEQLAQSLDGDCVIRHADTVDAARELIAAAQPCVVLVDVRTHPRPGEVIEKVQSPTDTSVIVLFAETEQTSTVASSIRNSAAYAVLPVPLEIAKTAAVLGGARDEVLTRRHVIDLALPATPGGRQPSVANASVASSPIGEPLSDDHHAHSTRRADAPPREPVVTDGRSKRLLAAGVAVLVGVSAAAWLATRDHSADAPQTAGAPAESTRGVIAAPPDVDEAPAAAAPAAPPAPTPLALKSGSVDDLLDLARSALNERRYTDPKNESALVYYRSALAQEPDNGEALEGLARIAVVLEERLQSALSAGRFDDAAQTIAQLKLAQVDATRMSAAESRIAAAQIGAALESDDADRAAVLLRQAEASQVLSADQVAGYRADVERRQAAARIVRAADLVTTRIREGKLVEPANGSAEFHLGQLRKLPGSGSRAAAATREFENAVLERARNALLQKQPAEAERWFAKARSMGIKPARITAVRRDARPSAAPLTSSVSEVERLARLVEERVADGRLLEPAQDNALVQLAALRAADAGNSTYPTSAGTVSSRLLAQGQSELTERRLDSAQAHATAARQLGLNLADVEALERGIADARAAQDDAPIQVRGDQIKRTRYVAPEYPEDAARQGVEGSVKVRFTIGTEGKVTDAAVVESTPGRVFDRSALAAVRRWRFEPVVVNGATVDATIETTVHFRLSEDGAR